MDVALPVLLLLMLAAFAAGWVDAVAGGGGLIQLPSIMAAGICLPPAAGVNKVSSITGTAGALVRYARAGHVRWAEVPVCGALALGGSMLGAHVLVGFRDACDTLTPWFAACFVALAVHQVVRVLRPRAPVPRRRPLLGWALILGIGLYDGFVGPGAGMFLFWTFTTCFALSPLDGTGTTKAINVFTNAGALIPLLLAGQVVWPVALGMASANLVGGQIGAHVTIRRGAPLIRLVAATVSVAAGAYLLLRR